MDCGKLLTQRRSELTLDGLLKLEALEGETELTRLHDRWKQGFSLMPFDRIVEPATENPLNWKLPNHHDRWVPSWSHRVGDYPLPQHGTACAFEYYECLSGNRPVAHAIEQEFTNTTRFYTRLLLPFEGRIIYATRSLVPMLPEYRIG